jgi:hypothetical protein
MIQISIAVLPIGAGASGYIGQQKQTSPILISLILLWLGLLTIAISVFINLRVIKSKEPSTSGERKSLDSTLSAGVIAFIVGTLFLVASPAGFAVNQMITPNHFDVSLSSRSIAIQQSKNSPVERNVVLTATNISTRQIENTKVEAITLDKQCVSAVKTNEVKPISDGDAWILEWKVTIEPVCPVGDQIVQFKFLTNNIVSGQSSLVLNIKP